MAKESLYLPSDSSIIYYWTFNSNNSVVDNPRAKATKLGTDVITYKDGIATFTGGTNGGYFKLKTLVNLGTKYSVSIRFKFTDLLTASSFDMVIAGKGSTLPSLLYYTYIGGHRLYHSATTGTSYITFTPDTNWHTYTVTRNGSTTVVYLDGVTQTVSGTLTVNTTFDTIGATSAGFSRFKGSIESIIIWNRQQSASEVKNNYLGRTYRALPLNSGEVLGSELVVNGGFDTDSSWSKNNTTILNGVANFITGTASYIRQTTFVAKINTLYRLRITVNYTSGSSFIVYNNTQIITTITSSGTYNLLFTSDNNNTTKIEIYSTSGIGTIDNISIKEVLTSSKQPLFHINSDNGVIRDLTGRNTVTTTSFLPTKIGSNISVVNCNGTTGNITLQTQVITGDLSFFTWINLRGLGEGSTNLYGVIFDNGQFRIWISETTNRIGVTRNNSTLIYSANNIFKFGNWLCLFITSNAVGITNISAGGLNTPLALSGTANQAATATTDTTRVPTIGNILGGDTRTLNGLLNDTIMFQGLLTIDEGTQLQTSTKTKYI